MAVPGEFHWPHVGSSQWPLTHPSSKRYPAEMRERAVRMVQQSIEESGERWGVVSRVARQLGIGEQTLRNWVERADIDAGKRPGVTTEDKARIAELEKEVRELRRANAILKSASAFFAAELDRPKPKCATSTATKPSSGSSRSAGSCSSPHPPTTPPSPGRRSPFPGRREPRTTDSADPRRELRGLWHPQGLASATPPRRGGRSGPGARLPRQLLHRQAQRRRARSTSSPPSTC